MKTTDYQEQVAAILNGTSYFPAPNGTNEGVFVIDWDTRIISIPEELENIAICDDHNSETVYFICDRYFDGQDLNDNNIKTIIIYNTPDNRCGRSYAINEIIDNIIAIAESATGIYVRTHSRLLIILFRFLFSK